MTWEDNHKARIEIHELANIIHAVKERLIGDHDEDNTCSCYKEAMEYYIGYGMDAAHVDTAGR